MNLGLVLVERPDVRTWLCLFSVRLRSFLDGLEIYCRKQLTDLKVLTSALYFVVKVALVCLMSDVESIRRGTYFCRGPTGLPGGPSIVITKAQGLPKLFVGSLWLIWINQIGLDRPSISELEAEQSS